MKITRSNVITGSLGVLAAASLLVGNGTFASWSDSYTDGPNTVGASMLKLNIDQSGVQEFDKINLIPGGQGDYEFVVASRDGAAVPLADLTLAIENLVDTEDGCSNTSSEAAVDDCATPGPGDFSGETRVTVNVSQPTDNPATACSDPRGNKLPAGVKTLKQLADHGVMSLLPAGTSLAPGQGICVGMALGLPVDATNAVQGDSASFEVKFNLTQHI